MVAPLELWLKRTRRIRSDTIIIKEFSWMGRWIDVATLTSSGCSTSYELKLYKNLDAIEQAASNSLAFDRSYVVTATPPSCKNLDIAIELKVGILILVNEQIRMAVRAPLQRHSSNISNRLKTALRDRID